MTRTSVELNANVSVTGAEQLNPLTERFNDIKDIQREIQSNNARNRSMPGFGGNNAIGNSSGKAVGAYSGTMDNAHEIARLKATIENLNRNIEKANEQIIKANESGDSRGTLNWASSLNQMEESKQRAQNELKRLEGEDKSDKGISALINDRYSQIYSQAINYAIQGFSISNNYRKAIAGGDYLGAGVARQEQVGGVAMGLGGGLMSAGAMMMATGVGVIPGAVVAGAGALGLGIGGLLKILAGNKDADNAESKAYENSLPYLHAFNKRYNSGDVDTVRVQADELRAKAVDYATGTGLSTYDFINTAIRQTSYGVSEKNALERTKMAAMWANSTGADLGTIQDILGISDRFGKATNTAYLAQAREASGLTKAQTNEFLQGLQSVIESGISSGFAFATEDVAKNFAMFANLSNNNPLWEGKYAAQKINSINSSIASAINLGDTNQVLTISVAGDIANSMNAKEFEKATGVQKTGTYVDAMIVAERGLSPSMFKGLGKMIDDMEGDNYQAKIERWKGVSGMNYKGATELYSMYRNNPNITDKEIEAKISKMKADSQYISEENLKAEAINRIDAHVQKIGQSKFWDNYEELLKLEKEQGARTERPAESGENSKVYDPFDAGNELTENTSKEERREVTNKLLNDGTMQLAMRGVPGEWGGNTFRNLKTKEGWGVGGNDKYDDIFKEQVALYAAFGENAGGDNKVTYNEIKRAMSAHDQDKDVQNAYKGDDLDAYVAALEAMLKRLFGSLEIEASN